MQITNMLYQKHEMNTKCNRRQPRNVHSLHPCQLFTLHNSLVILITKSCEQNYSSSE